MSENDKNLLDALTREREKYYIFVDNDNVTVLFRDGDEIAGTFDEFGYHLLNNIFNYLGFQSELV